MNLDEIPLFTMIKSKLGYISQRERLIAQNVANADTPGYAPHDLKPFTIRQGPGGAVSAGSGGLAMVQPIATNPAHMTGSGGGTDMASAASQWKPIEGADSETTLDGNKVTLEDEMNKMTESRMDYEAAIGFYQKALEMLTMATRAPGKS